MAETIKVLGQSNPSATTLTTFYTVPADTSTVCSTLAVCNRSATPTTFRVSVAVLGAADLSTQYILYDAPIDGNETLFLTIGLTLSELDEVRAYSTLATLSFSLFGAERDVS